MYVSRLRKLLPAGVLVTRPPGYVLKVEVESVDLLRFERLVAEARGADPARGTELLGEALASWRGPALAELSDEPFARVEAARLEALRLATLLGDRGLAAYARMYLAHLDKKRMGLAAEEAIRTFADLGDERRLALARYQVVLVGGWTSRNGFDLAELERVLAVLADSRRDRHPRRSVVVSLLGELYIGPTPVEDAIRRCEELRRSSKNDPWLEATVERSLFLLCALAGRDNEARHYGRRGTLLLNDLGYSFSRLLSHSLCRGEPPDRRPRRRRTRSACHVADRQRKRRGWITPGSGRGARARDVVLRPGPVG